MATASLIPLSWLPPLSAPFKVFHLPLQKYESSSSLFLFNHLGIAGNSENLSCQTMSEDSATKTSRFRGL